MKNFFRWSFLIAIVIAVYINSPASASGPLTVDGSTQFLWGNDLLNEEQPVLAQYIRLNYSPEGKDYRLTGYGRVWDALSEGGIRSDEPSGRIYYMFVDYTPREDRSIRLGRQFVSFTADSAIIDGLSVDIRDIGPVGITFSGGTEVIYSLDSEYSKLGTYFTGFDIFLEKVTTAQLGVSYVRKYDNEEHRREEFGLNARYFYKILSPYATIKYDWITQSFAEVATGIDFFPISFLTIKTEFYHSYPTFDSTSIYSVFAVDKYQEYHVRAEYSFEDMPLILSASYIYQAYEDSETADVYAAGASFHPDNGFLVSTSVDYRKGYGGKLWGFDVHGDYNLRKELLLSGGAQYDTYRRPDYTDDDYAQRYWAGGKWTVNDRTSLEARLEANINENFDHNFLGRIAMYWQL